MDRVTCMEAFVRVVDAGSFSEAARRWGRSKAVVSKYVGQLESHLDVRLLNRTTRSVGLTDAGRAHYERTSVILNMLEESEAQLRANHVKPRGVLRVSAPPGLFAIHGRGLIAPFIQKYPEVEVELDLTHRLIDLVEERIDVAIRLTQPEDSSLIARRLADAPLMLVASPAYLARCGTPSHPFDLTGHDCIVDTNHRFVGRWPFKLDGTAVTVPVRALAKVNSPTLLRDMAMDGLGIGLLPRMVAHAAVEGGELVEVLPDTLDVRWSLWAITSHRRHLPLRARVFIEYLQAYFSDGRTL